MSTRSLTTLPLAILCAGFAVVAADAQRRPPTQVPVRPQVAIAQPPRQVFTSLSAAPDSLVASVRTTVTVTAVLAPQYARTRLRAQLVRVTADKTEQVLAEMEQAGRRISARHTFSESETGRVALRVKLMPATPPATAMVAARPPDPVYSQVLSLVVQPAPERPQLEAGGLRARWPAGWTANRRVAQRGGPWSGNNFAGRYQTGGVVPAGGCEIEATSVPRPGSDIENFVRREAEPGAVVRPVTIRDWRGFEADYDEEFGGLVRYHVTAVYLVADDRLFKIYLTYRAGDGVAGTCRAGLDQMLATFEPGR